MSEVLNNTRENFWDNIGVYPTPDSLVEEFGQFVMEQIDLNIFGSNEIKVADIFCGDGRLGVEIEKKLVSKGIESKVTFVEIINEYLSKTPIKSNYEKVNANVFEIEDYSKYDLIVSNPPYLVLNSNDASSLGFDWDLVKDNSKNLYALSILKGLELCKNGGVLCVIAPFGYLRGYNSQKFKNKLESLCDRIIIKAQKNRNLFEGVNQDIAFQIFYKSSNQSLRCNSVNWQFGYNGHPIETIKGIELSKKTKDNTEAKKKSVRVRVGPIVWNRSKKSLKSRNGRRTVTLIYGANIKKNNNFDFKIPKLEDRQYIDSSKIIESDIINTPAIIMRRTMNGQPGKWSIDSSVLYRSENNLKYTAENHTIVVEFQGYENSEINDLNSILTKAIEEYYFISGSPTISTKVVGEIINNKLNN